jgi:RNA polymerase sigma factor (sigma-70 family)
MGEVAHSTANVPPAFPHAGRLSSDGRLARLARGGSAAAFAALYQRHHQALYRYCLSIVRTPEDAQDALQSTFERAFAALQASRRDVAMRPWLFRIAHNEAVSILRRRRGGDDQIDAEVPSASTVEGTVAQRERLAMLVADLQELPVRQRAALLMRELSGLSIAEIAVALSISPGVAKQTLFEARASLHAFAEGRATQCEVVRRAISDGDGRALRGRAVRAHLRACAACEEFRALIDTRRVDLRALVPPLPATASASLLVGLLAHAGNGGHAAASGGAATSVASGATNTSAGGLGLGGHALSSVAVKGLIGLAIVAAAGAGAVRLVKSPGRSAPHHAAPLRPSGPRASSSHRSSRAAATSHRASARVRSRPTPVRHHRAPTAQAGARALARPPQAAPAAVSTPPMRVSTIRVSSEPREPAAPGKGQALGQTRAPGRSATREVPLKRRPGRPATPAHPAHAHGPKATTPDAGKLQPRTGGTPVPAPRAARPTHMHERT